MLCVICSKWLRTAEQVRRLHPRVGDPAVGRRQDRRHYIGQHHERAPVCSTGRHCPVTIDRRRNPAVGGTHPTGCETAGCETSDAKSREAISDQSVRPQRLGLEGSDIPVTASLDLRSATLCTKLLMGCAILLGQCSLQVGNAVSSRSGVGRLLLLR